MNRVAVPGEVAERLSKQVCNFQRVFAGARARGVSAPETAAAVHEALVSLFGLGRDTEIDAEAGSRGGAACRLVIQIEGRPQALVEVVAVGSKLDDDMRRRAIGGAANRGLRWVVLTNARDWEIFRSEEEPTTVGSAVAVWDFFEISPRREADQQQLFLLCREGLLSEALETQYQHVKAVNRHSVSAVILSAAGLDLIRRELRRGAQGIDVSDTEIRDLLLGVLREDVLPRPPQITLRPPSEPGPVRLDDRDGAEARWAHSTSASLRLTG